MKGVPTAARSIFVCRTSIRRPLLARDAIVPYPAVPRNVTEVILPVSGAKRTPFNYGTHEFLRVPSKTL